VYASRWSPELRQGDIIGKVHFPALSAVLQMQSTVSSLAATVTPEEPGNLIVPTQKLYVVVISHCCDFNPGKTNRMLLARLERMPGNLAPERLDALRAANDFEAALEAGAENVAGVDNFVLEPLPGCFDEEMVVTFSSTTPFPMKHKDTFVKLKQAELEHGVRLLFRKKLAWFFGGRDPDDIDDSLKFDRPEILDDPAPNGG
jgi:hypothetical protein